LDATDTEGRRILIRHSVAERSAKLVWAFKRTLVDYRCRVCGFNFRQMYGELGADFIEAHHTNGVPPVRWTPAVVGVASNRR
jgi:predicted HNH restriction endonuclease